jgi:hypothetical protein
MYSIVQHVTWFKLQILETTILFHIFMYLITTFVCILTSDYMHPIGHPRHDLNYKFMKIIFYSINQILLCNFKAKNFCTHLDQWFYASKWPSRDIIQILNLWILKIFRNIFKMDVEMCTKMSGVQWWKPFLNPMFRWGIRAKKNERELYGMHTCTRTSVLSACVRCCLVEHPARREVFMRRRIDFNSSNH